MDIATTQIIVLGSLVIAFGGFASYMAERQAVAEAKDGKSNPKDVNLSEVI